MGQSAFSTATSSDWPERHFYMIGGLEDIDPAISPVGNTPLRAQRQNPAEVHHG